MTEITDPFDVLRRPDAPIAPSAAFAKQLRQRLIAELGPLLLDTTSQTRGSSENQVSMSVTPYLIVHDAAAALEFYRDAFGAVEIHRLVGADGRIGHSEFTIGTSTVMMADEHPEIDALGPRTRGGPTCSFTIEVGSAADVDVMFANALTLGARSMREPADQFHGSRSGTLRDPFGHSWTLSALIEQLSPAQYAARAGVGSYTMQGQATSDAPHPQSKHLEQGDLYYFTMPVADLARAQRFFGAVLGWQFPSADQGHIENISAPPGGVNTSSTDPGPRLWFVVDDIHTAVERVRAAGGTAQDPVNYESGWSSDCTDDQGTYFSLSVPSPEYSN